MYDLTEYSKDDMLRILDLNHPTKAELEAKIKSLIRKYAAGKTSEAKQMHQFFMDMYDHFFEGFEGFEGFENQKEEEKEEKEEKEEEKPVQMSQNVQYAAGRLNPLLKETFKRTITIDSQYRDTEQTNATDFTLNFTETLKNVVSLKLYSIQLPVTWYTISQAYGSNFFWLKSSTEGITSSYHQYKITIEPGNYNQTSLTTVLAQSFQTMIAQYPDVSFGNTGITYGIYNCKATIHVDIQKVYNEAYYYLELGPQLSYYLGFVDTSLNVVNTALNFYTIYTEKPSTSYPSGYPSGHLYILRYAGIYDASGCLEYDTSFSTIDIPLTLETKDEYEYTAYVNNALHTCKFLDPISALTLSGDIYTWTIKLNRTTTANIPSSKICLHYPDLSGVFGFPDRSPNAYVEMNAYGTYPVQSGSIIINELISFKPLYDPSGGVYTGTTLIDSTTRNDISIVIDSSFNTPQALLTEINFQINEHEVLKGTFFSLVDGYVKLRVNINKIYTSNDYSLVFYNALDVTNANASNLTSYRPTTADTTLGWILGYRTLSAFTINNSVDFYSFTLNDTPYTVMNVYTNTAVLDVNGKTVRYSASITGDTTVSVNLYNYFIIVLDDFNQNHLNDGLVTITKRDLSVSLPPYANRKYFTQDPDGNQLYDRNILGGNLTGKQLYSVNEIVQAQTLKNSNDRRIVTSGPFIKDMFAIIPIKTNNLNPCDIYVEFGGTLQVQERLFFGPVNINRMHIQLLNDKGDTVDLNGSNWSIQLVCEQLYQRAGH